MSTGARPQVIFCPLKNENWGPKTGDARKLGTQYIFTLFFSRFSKLTIKDSCLTFQLDRENGD